MKIQDFQPSKKDQIILAEVDQLVDYGLSRVRAERIIKQLHDLADGPWADLLAPFAEVAGTQEEQLERKFFQGCFIAFVAQWVEERAINAAIVQGIALARLASIDAKELPHG